VKEMKNANRLIEEFMLQANLSVAQKISSTFPEQALLRRHATPIDRKLVGRINDEQQRITHANPYTFHYFDRTNSLHALLSWVTILIANLLELYKDLSMPLITVTSNRYDSLINNMIMIFVSMTASYSVLSIN
jgi:hypothetical protein